ncbi:MAG TPA: two-component regulator propeller domain-containing protein [Verrucomicrobiae bacterium]|nr:two-component regulator propeller domain-containing protein [Verrucomicrobiae bacterium]
MFRTSAFSCSSGPLPRALARWGVWALMVLAGAFPARAVILWNAPDPMLVHETGTGRDILGGAVKRDDSANDTLYFKFHVDPLSDKDTEEYSAAFELFEGDSERVGIGNAMKAWAYSAFFHADEAGESNNLAGYTDLHTSKPEAAGDPSGSYQFPRRNVGVTIVFKVQYVPGEDDLVTVWLNPDLGPGANEVYQPESLTTQFNANARFNEIRLRHAGGGGGWTFSDMAVATSFTDFVDVSSARPGEGTAAMTGGPLSFNFRSWEKEQGLPQSSIQALAQTRDGYLWLGCGDGIVRFDGLRFVAPGMQEGLSNGPVRILFGDHLGALWVGRAPGGLIRWQNNQMTGFTMREGLPSGSVTALAEDNTGRVWIGTDAGLVLWQDGQLVSLKAAEPFKGQPITALFKDRSGTLWIGVKGAGVFQLAGDKFVPVTGDTLDDLLKDPHGLLVDQTGRMWIAAGEDSVLCREGGHWYRYRIPRSMTKSPVSSLAEESDGTIWAGADGGGLLQFKENKFVEISMGGEGAGNQIESLLTDREGKLWVGTAAGLKRLQRKCLFAFGQNEGLGFGAVQGLAEVAPGVIWAAKPNGSLYRWDGKYFSWLTTAGLLSHDSQVSALLVTRDGHCWMATSNSLLLYKDPLTAADEVKSIELTNASIISLAEDSGGALWLGTRAGKIWQLRAGKWLAQANVTNAVTAIVPDPDGSIWFGTDGSGLYRFMNGTFSRVDKGEGLLSDKIRTLYLDVQGTLWIGTDGGGLSRWRNGRMASFTTRDGLSDNTISQILEDDAGRLWLGSSGGIASVLKARLDELAAGKIANVYPQHFGRAEGMLSEECTGGFGPAGLKTKSGLLWFPTSKGVVVVNPRVQPATAFMPNTVLEEVLVDGVPDPLLHGSAGKTAKQDGQSGKEISRLEMLRITPGKHRVEFRYTGLNFDAPDLIRFRYRLEGLDGDWVDAGTRRTAFYSYLPPGDYRFRVAACNSDGLWSESESSLELTVSRHFWQTWWFITLAGLSLMISVGVAVRVVEKRKLQRRLKHLEQERALERERTRIAQDLHDEMGAKLCRISFLSEHARRGELPPQELRDQISSISDASREVLHSLDEIVWAVNPQNDTLEHVASYIGQYAQEYFQLTGIECELDIPAQLPAHPLSSQMRHHLFLATHEALTNILKHSGAAHAKISMAYSNATFEINISDDGKGFEPPPFESKPPSTTAASGDGLNNMWQRLADIGGHCSIESASGRGTNIRFVITLNPLVKNT